MIINGKKDFINELRKYEINTEYLIVKPNWVSDKDGEYTEAEILDWLLEAFPNQKKIIIESYTPWRGLVFKGLKSFEDLGAGKKYWDHYREQDQRFLEKTGIQAILNKHHVQYVNTTNEYWKGNCVKPDVIQAISSSDIYFSEFYSYIPKDIFKIKRESTLVSLSKIKTEQSIPEIYASLSTKNLFGLIPNPSCRNVYHGKNHKKVSGAIRDIYSVYTSIFNHSLWITEGIFSLVKNYCSENQEIEKNKKLLFVGHDAKRVDSDACSELGLDPKKIPYF